MPSAVNDKLIICKIFQLTNFGVKSFVVDHDQSLFLSQKLMVLPLTLSYKILGGRIFEEQLYFVLSRLPVWLFPLKGLEGSKLILVTSYLHNTVHHPCD